MKLRSGKKSKLAAFALSLLFPLLTSACQIESPGQTDSTSPYNLVATATTQSPPQTGIPTTTVAVTAASTSADNHEGKIGEQVVSDGIAVTVLDITRVPQASFLLTGQGSDYLDVDVLVENINRDDGLPYNPYYFKIEDELGNVSNASLSTIDVSLKTGNLGKGEMVRGHIGFQVRSNATSLVLSFEPNIFIPDYIPIHINLTQQSSSAVTAPTCQPPLDSGQLDQRITTNNMALTVNSISRPETISIYQPADGRMFLDLNVQIENTAQEGILAYNPLDFKLKDSNGFEYTAALIALQPSLRSGELGPGKTAKGHLSFEVRQNASGFTLTFQPMALFKDIGVITVDLGE